MTWMITPQEAANQNWDVIVIGAGMGGGLAGRRLAESGQSVLFVEKGPAGYRNEQQDLRADVTDPVARQIRGYWPKPMVATIDGAKSRFFAPVGCGIGGSSTFYAAALERPERHDIESTPDLPHPSGGWPMSYDALQPYFTQAESLLHIRGTPDPLSAEAPPELAPPVPISAEEESMIADFREQGLHPYRQHLALRDVPDCQSCLGRKCPQTCKMDGRSAGVEPALQTGRAQIVTDCTVQQVLDNGHTVTGITLSHDAKQFTLRARVYVLAAGALGSPRLLLASTGRDPAGCANSSGWVGRGLMFHLNEVFAVWPRMNQKFAGATKAISLRDLYTFQGHRLGMIQSMGLPFSYENIAHYLGGLYDRSALRRFRRLRYGTNVMALIAARVLGQAKVFVGIMEDMPYPENRVVPAPHDPDVLAITYTLSPELQARRRLFRKQIRKRFRRNRILMLGHAPELNFGHPSGTLRCGNDPATSVLDRNCKAHDLDNLYVADASFMPTSMGVNPSLTIAANALRVADTITQSLQSTQHEDRKYG